MVGLKDEGRPKRQKPQKKNRLKDIQPGRLNSAISNEMYMQINLQDLENYTNSILEAERARRRSLICRIVFLVWLVAVFVGGYRYSHMTSQAEPELKVKDNVNNNTDWDREDANYKAYPLTNCEIELAHNMSFHDLVKSLRENSETAKKWHCRPEVSYKHHWKEWWIDPFQ